MSRKLQILLLLLFSGTCSATEPLVIENVQAKLFYNHTGAVSPPLSKDSELLNVIIGGGVAEPSNATLVDVTVRGDPGSYTPRAHVDLTVTHTHTGKLISKKSVDIGVLSASGTFHAGFWLPDTGCEPLTISARLRGAKRSVQTHVPFACGE